MTHHPTEDTLHRLVDAELSPGEIPGAERHIADCPSCREMVQKLERLRRTANAAPREVQPPPEILGEILTRLPDSLRVLPDTRERESATRRSPSRGGMWLAAAAIVLIVVSGVMGPALRLRPTVTTDGDRSGTAVESPAHLAAVPTTGADAGMVEQLMRDLEARRHVLDPQTIILVEQNLRTIAAAITATQDALAADPNNVHLETMLTRARRQQMEYIRSTLAIASDQ